MTTQATATTHPPKPSAQPGDMGRPWEHGRIYDNSACPGMPPGVTVPQSETKSLVMLTDAGLVIEACGTHRGFHLYVDRPPEQWVETRSATFFSDGAAVRGIRVERLFPDGSADDTPEAVALAELVDETKVWGSDYRDRFPVQLQELYDAFVAFCPPQWSVDKARFMASMEGANGDGPEGERVNEAIYEEHKGAGELTLNGSLD